MSHATLKALIENTPECAGKSPEEIASILNALEGTTCVETWATERTIISAFANPMDGEAFLQKLAAAGQQNPLIARALRWIEPGQQGIDVSHPHTAMLLGSLLQQEAITQAEYNAVMGIAPKSKPAANVTAEQVWNALNWTGE
jgi:hypothetical protein